MNIKEMKGQIWQLRNAGNELASELATRYEPVEKQIAFISDDFNAVNAELIASKDELMSKADALEAELRAYAVETYAATGNKALGDGVSVRVSPKLLYSNDDAVEWARRNMPIAIIETVDKKAFESLPNVAELDFVRSKESASAVVSWK